MVATPDRMTRSAKPAWRQEIETLWRWWTAQLAREVPESLGGLGMKRAPVVALRDRTIVLLEGRGNSAAEIGEAPIATLDLEGRRIALRSLLARVGESDPRVRLCLARDESLMRRVELPLATEENLSQVLSFEMDRLTPFRGDEVYFAHRIASRDAAASRIHVDLGVARRSLVDERIAELRECGAEVQSVVLADDVARWNSPLDLMPEGLPGAGEGARERNRQMAAAGVVLLLLVVALALPLWQKREAVIALQPEVTKAKAEAESTDALSRELDKIVADYNFLLTKKHYLQPTLALVEELTRLMPDNTWVQQLDIRPAGKVREVQISGETPSSSKLIEIFEQSKILQNAAPRGSVVRGQVPGNERFLIAAEVRPRALPDAVPISMAARLSAPPTPNVPVAPVNPAESGAAESPAKAPAEAAKAAAEPAKASATASGPVPAAAPQPGAAPSKAPPSPAPTATVTPVAPAKPGAPLINGGPVDFGPPPGPPQRPGDPKR